MTIEQEQKRWEEMPAPIRELSHNNPLVHDILHRYAIGIIITKEEALCQMIVGLSRDWAKQKADYIELVHRHGLMGEIKGIR